MQLTKTLTGIIFLAAFSACAVRPEGQFDAGNIPPAPDYSDLANWAAHPDKKDMADRTPLPGIKDAQAEALVDVLYFYPTTYTGTERYETDWNADVNDFRTNKKTDEGAVLFQASIFNGTGRVYAPRYRQAHLNVFYNKKKQDSAKAALALAYTDIEEAFDYYMKHWNDGRPFIIAAHSQGALHAMNLIKKKIEGTPLQSQLVTAYIVGWPVNRNFYQDFQPCEKPDQINCYCSWRTWNRNFVLDHSDDKRLSKEIVCTNPLCWTTTEGQYVSKADNLGGVVRPFEKVYPAITDAEIYQGVLLSRKPKFKGSFLFRRKNYHIGDLNLFYMNVRKNVQTRTEAYLKR